MRRPSHVTVKRPDPKTGELIEEVVGATHFRPRPPRRPCIRTPRRVSGPGAVGIHWLAVYELRERELLYWLGHRERLTRSEREAVAAGTTSIVRPIDSGWEGGEVFDIARDLRVEVVETTWLKRRIGGPFERDLQYRTTLRVIDERPMLLRRGVLGAGAHQGAEDVTENREEEEKSRVDSAYTSSPSRSIDGAGEEIDESLHYRLHRHQAAATARRQATLSKAQKIERLEERIVRANEKHERRLTRILERQLQSMRHPGKAA